jgi:hypothetical protein
MKQNIFLCNIIFNFIKYYNRPDDFLQLQPKLVAVNKYMKKVVLITLLIYVLVICKLRLIFQRNPSLWTNTEKQPPIRH